MLDVLKMTADRSQSTQVDSLTIGALIYPKDVPQGLLLGTLVKFL